MSDRTPVHLCGAKTRSGSPCRKPAGPNGRCRNHGGATPSGIASAQFKHGRYSAAMPARLLQTYQAVINDPDLLELRSAIAVTDSLIVDKLKSLDTGESGKVWDGLSRAWDDLRMIAGNSQPQQDRRRSLMLQVGDLITQGERYGSAQDDLTSLLDTRRKLVRDEAARLKAMSAMISTQEAMTLIGALASLVREHVTDQAALRAISDGIAAIMARHAAPFE